MQQIFFETCNQVGVVQGYSMANGFGVAQKFVTVKKISGVL